MLERVKDTEVKNNEDNSLYLESDLCLSMSISSLKTRKFHFTDEGEQLSPAS